MQVRFGALMNVNSMAGYSNPDTGQQDNMSEQMAHAVIPQFNDPLTHHILETTCDEVVVTPQRKRYQSRNGTGIVEAIDFNVRIEGLDNYQDTMGGTIGFNPFAQVSRKGKMLGIQDGKAAVLETIIQKDRLAKQLKAEAQSDAAKS